MSEMYKMTSQKEELVSLRSHLNLKAREFAAQYKTDERGVLLDVRSRFENATYGITGATNILWTDRETLRKLSKTKNYYIHSCVGQRSADVARLLISEGFRGVINLDDRVEILMDYMNRWPFV